MIEWTFFLDVVEIDQPIGFADVVIRAKRDELWHGIYFEASTSDLTFYGTGAAYLVDKKETLGFASDVEFRAVATCGEEIDVLAGKLDFRKYRRSCGNECLVSMPVEMDGCIMTLRNRYDQKVDLSNNVAFDKLTVLPSYTGLNFAMDLPAQDLDARVEGFSLDDHPIVSVVDNPGSDSFGVSIRPSYTDARFNSINQGQLDPASNYEQLPAEISFPISPQLLFDDNIDCFTGNFDYQFRFKGRVSINANITGLTVTAFLMTWNGQGSSLSSNGTVIDFNQPHAIGSYTGDTVLEFDISFSGVIALTSGLGFYGFISVAGFDSSPQDFDVDIEFDPETYVNIFANKSCPVTEVVVSLIHETASRITEAITDRCLTVKSDYFGRTDSQPYAAAEDGCGSLRVLSSGLRLRKAENPVHFMSLKDLFDGLNAIDNIGMGVEGDELRIEPVEYFYQDIEILQMPFVPKANVITEDKQAYSIIKVGYKKWETEVINGLDEFNSNKEYRTSLKNISNPLDITSAFIAGGYPIEQTRQQSFAETGGADTKYDNETFIICVIRGGYNYLVEQGNIASAANFYSPATAYNWRIRPFYNLMRWWKSIIQSYANLVSTTSRLIFSAGTGNLEAEGELATYDPCRLESTVRAENDDLQRTDFMNESLPIWQPDNIVFTYPMSLRDFNLVKTTPHGYISVQCGTGDFVKAYITNLLYKPVKGEADLTLRLKWQ